MYEALMVARYVINKCIEVGNPISNLQLQKILYYIQKAYLMQGEPAFYEKIEAWQFGPVVPVVYYKYCGFGSLPITFRYGDTELHGDTRQIDQIISEKSYLPPWDLVAETHKEGGAWDLVYRNGAGNHKEIPRDLIRQCG